MEAGHIVFGGWLKVDHAIPKLYFRGTRIADSEPQGKRATLHHGHRSRKEDLIEQNFAVGIVNADP
jgi:hypothetical protein